MKTYGWLLLVLLFHGSANAAEIVFLHSPEIRLDEKEMVRTVSEFYGLDLTTYELRIDDQRQKLEAGFGQQDVIAVIVSARLLPAFGGKQPLSNFVGDHIPILILGITPETDAKMLKEISAGSVKKCVLAGELARHYAVGDMPELTHELSGQRLPGLAAAGSYFLDLDPQSHVRRIIELNGLTDSDPLPAFVKTIVAGRELFLHTEINISELPAASNLDRDILRLLPTLIFLRYAGGDRRWHAPGYYANLTIDDPWLTEPYGHLSYAGILSEMKQANFHTTIAFIPWNFDRSALDVVALFKATPERFSLSVHGNNHDHREFAIKSPGDVSTTQEADVSQALGRMEKMRTLTGLNYDPVMVFPHGIAGSSSLTLLRKYNYWATVNGANVPSDQHEPAEPLFRLGATTLRFENFPSIRRFWPDRPEFEIALDLFLENPLLFYTHQDFFETGIDAFNATATMVNRIQPEVNWVSLGQVVQRLYVQRKRVDGDFDVFARSGNFTLENDTEGEVVYYVRRPVNSELPVAQLRVDQAITNYDRSESEINLSVAVPCGGSRQVVIEFENDFDISSMDISKNDVRVSLIRHLSDFRDMTLSTSQLGRTITRIYYKSGFFKLGLWWIPIALTLVGAVTLGVRRRTKGRRLLSRKILKGNSVRPHGL